MAKSSSNTSMVKKLGTVQQLIIGTITKKRGSIDPGLTNNILANLDLDTSMKKSGEETKLELEGSESSDIEDEIDKKKGKLRRSATSSDLHQNN